MRKTIKVAEAVARIPDGASIMIGGFMAMGTLRTVQRLEALFVPSRTETRS